MTTLSRIIAGGILHNGAKTVAVAGTAEALAGNIELNASVVQLQALATNTGNVFVGNSNVDNTNGYILAAGETVMVPINNLNKVYIDVAVAGEGVRYLAS